MRRRGLTLIEILVAGAVFMVVGSGIMYSLSSSNQNWSIASGKISMELTAKATLEEISRAVRMTGSGLPDRAGGMKVHGAGSERVVFVMNESGGVDTVRQFSWKPGSGILRIQINDATRFALKGHVRLNLDVPPMGSHRSANLGTFTKSFTLGVVDLTSSRAGCGDSLLLDVRALEASPYNWNDSGDISALTNSLVQNIDSITYSKSGDTLYLKRNIQDSTPFTTGVDSLRIWYHHPTDGWGDSLSGSAPADKIDMVKIRLVMRTKNVDFSLLRRDRGSRGYRFLRMETEVSLRNTELTNR
jgi:hypothetical protein